MHDTSLKTDTHVVRGWRWLTLIILLAPSEPGSGQALQAEGQSLFYAGIEDFPRGGYTWVAYSSLDCTEALEMQKTFRRKGVAGDILAGRVDGEIYYRVVFGQYTSRQAADIARQYLKAILPTDAWLLILKPGMELLPQTDWLPLSSLQYVEPSQQDRNSVASESVVREGQDAPPAAASKADEAIVYDAQDPVGQVAREEQEQAEPDNAENAEIASPPAGSFLNRHFGAKLQFSNIYEDNIDHDSDFEAIPSYGMVPALGLQFRSGPSDPVFSVEYLVARHSYSNTERWDRISHSFRGALKPVIGESLHLETSAEWSLKGNSEDRDISNQFQIRQEIEFRFSRRHRFQIYGTYRVKRYPDDPEARDFKPNVGINFERTNSDGERFESGARYEFNKEIEARGNYRRWSFSVAYRTPEFKERDQFEIEVTNRRRLYPARYVELQDEDHLRQDTRLTIDAVWTHRFNRGVSLELGYEFETRGSNDPDRIYEANAFSLIMAYEL